MSRRSPATAHPKGELPSGAARLFPELCAAPHPERDLSAIAARLMEEGDSADLVWLTRHSGEAELARRLAARGGRDLSRRSRAFWHLLLAVDPSPEPPLRGALWPL